MSNVNQILFNAAERLGLREETTVVKKSDELLRVLNSKATVTKLGDYARAVLCLDLSCTFYGLGFDKETALLLSGLKKLAYQNCLNMLEKVLELDKPLTISEVCVQHSCTVIKDLAEQILELYRQYHSMADISHPQYIAAAIYTACKLKSIKVQKSQFISISRLKPMQWKELELAFLKFSDKVGLNMSIPQQKTTRNELHEFIEEHAITKENVEDGTTLIPDEFEAEDYEVWKERILVAAEQALLEVSIN